MSDNKELNNEGLKQVSGGLERANDLKNNCGDEICDIATMRSYINQDLYFESKRNPMNIFLGKVNSVEEYILGFFKCEVTITNLPDVRVVRQQEGDKITITSNNYNIYKKIN